MNDLEHADVINKLYRIWEHLSTKTGIPPSVMKPAADFLISFARNPCTHTIREWRELWQKARTLCIANGEAWSPHVQTALDNELAFVHKCLFGKSSRSTYSVLHGKSVAQFMRSHNLEPKR